MSPRWLKLLFDPEIAVELWTAVTLLVVVIAFLVFGRTP